MITKNPMQLKAFIKKKATEKNISAQLVMQNYMLERLLERLSLSPYKRNFILKGGFLISAIVGLDTRTTMDLDATIKGLNLTHGQVNTYNANRPHGFGLLNPAAFSPYPKNPVIGAFFREIDRADELGSGMRNLMKYGKFYGGSDPQRAGVWRTIFAWSARVRPKSNLSQTQVKLKSSQSQA